MKLHSKVSTDSPNKIFLTSSVGDLGGVAPILEQVVGESPLTVAGSMTNNSQIMMTMMMLVMMLMLVRLDGD